MLLKFIINDLHMYKYICMCVFPEYTLIWIQKLNKSKWYPQGHAGTFLYTYPSLHLNAVFENRSMCHTRLAPVGHILLVICTDTAVSEP